MTKAEYFRDRHLIAVQEAARRAGVKGAAFAVLSYLCSASAFTKPTVCVSKETICNRTGYTLKPVKAALARLRDLGVIVPVACLEGGRGRSTIYKLTTKAEKGGENCPPNGPEGEKGGSFSHKGGHFFPQRGVENAPPSISSSISSSRGQKGRGLVAPDAAAHAASARGGDRARQLVPVRPDQVRGMLIDWGFGATEIETFQEREVVALLRAEGFRLAV